MNKLPRRIKIKEILQGRYSDSRPLSWDERKSGLDIVRTSDGETIRLFSDGGQSTPQVGWELLLTREKMLGAEAATEWTLYGIPSQK